MLWGGRAKRGFGRATPSKPAECRILRTIGSISVLWEGKNHERSGLGERAYVPTLFLKKKDGGGGSMCENRKEKEKNIRGSLIEAPDVAGVHHDKKKVKEITFIREERRRRKEGDEG